MNLMQAMPQQTGSLHVGTTVAIGLECASLFGTNLDIGLGTIQQLDNNHFTAEGTTHSGTEWSVHIDSDNGQFYHVAFCVTCSKLHIDIRLRGASCFAIKQDKIVYEGLDLESGLPTGIVQAGKEECPTDEAKVLFSIPNQDDFNVTTVYLLNREHYS